jgi:hypothetical protein
MENINIIDYHQTRDFSRKMSATFEYVKQNFKSLGKSILYIAGPPVLVASMLMGSFFGEFFNATIGVGKGGNINAFQEYFISPSFWLELLLMMIFFVVSGVATISTINNYLLLYEQKQTNKIEVHEVWEKVRSTFGMYLGTMLLFGLLAIIVYVVMIVPVVLLAAVSPFLIFFGVIILFCGIFYFIIGSSLIFIIRTYENIGFFNAITRSFKLIQGKWWSTFGLLMVLYLLVMTVSYVFIVPWYIITMVSAFHNVNAETFQEPSSSWQIMTMIFFTLYYLAQMVLYALPNVGIAFQYFNLVERKEARGLMNQIETLGQTPATPADTQQEEY